ncbi:hypothetical protein THASP1DRAFT_22611 [Thamnocephalis sphaerospora]|uniref:PB1 domain-containing protein n=1 Tax=Thamnocephalis sphaerospora TaxID=78915 RepID=A0A4P9XTR9_9FUNG|nr:hypothetical protein THASP1DRAFT_22611 [Thamnocephalis sphaerospora]|eukprot:RKP09573.1 hypothetical protein THASP1DRAFT_22611 [Thamnocephalis sphaerospora]
MSQPLAVKILHGKIARRFAVPADITWQNLAAQVHERFALPGAAADVRLAYVDEDGDRIVFDSDAELHDALHQVSSNNKTAARFWIVPADDFAFNEMADISTTVTVNGDAAEDKIVSADGSGWVLADADTPQEAASARPAEPSTEGSNSAAVEDATVTAGTVEVASAVPVHIVPAATKAAAEPLLEEASYTASTNQIDNEEESDSDSDDSEEIEADPPRAADSAGATGVPSDAVTADTEDCASGADTKENQDENQEESLEQLLGSFFDDLLNTVFVPETAEDKREAERAGETASSNSADGANANGDDPLRFVFGIASALPGIIQDATARFTPHGPGRQWPPHGSWRPNGHCPYRAHGPGPWAHHRRACNPHANFPCFNGMPPHHAAFQHPWAEQAAAATPCASAGGAETHCKRQRPHCHNATKAGVGEESSRHPHPHPHPHHHRHPHHPHHPHHHHRGFQHGASPCRMAAAHDPFQAAETGWSANTTTAEAGWRAFVTELLAQLKSMGFSDEAQNHRLLERYDGSLVQVIDALTRGKDIQDPADEDHVAA